MTIREWLMADICLMYIMVGLMVSALICSVKDKKVVAVIFVIVGVIITIFVLVNILYFYIFKEL